MVLLVQENGVQPTARHANSLIFAEAMFVSVHTAVNGPLKEMQEGRLGVGCRPNTDSYNCIIMARPATHAPVPSPMCDAV